MDLDSMRGSIITEFTHRWELNDRAHRIEHFQDVERCGNHINDKLGLGFDPKLIMLVAFFHDMFAWSRFNHERLSGEWVATTDHPIICALTQEERTLVSLGCAEHRASFKGTYSNDFTEMMSSADRGFPMELEAMIQRSALYHEDVFGFGPEQARIAAIAHMKDKYTLSGYARYPSIYRQVFGNVLAEKDKAINAL